MKQHARMLRDYPFSVGGVVDFTLATSTAIGGVISAFVLDGFLEYLGGGAVALAAYYSVERARRRFGARRGVVPRKARSSRREMLATFVLVFASVVVVDAAGW